VHAKKKGFAELLGNLAPPSADDYNGRPRLVKGTVSAKQHVPASIPRPPYADNGFLPDMVRSIHWSPYDRVRVVNADP
jgi:hypothetical protein